MVIENLNKLEHFNERNRHHGTRMYIRGKEDGGAIASFPWVRI